MRMEFSAGGLIYKKVDKHFQIVLVLDSFDKWTFPKGHIEKGEKPEIAAGREVAEEIGFENVRVVKLLDKISYWFKQDDDTIHKFVYFYLMEAPVNAVLTHQTAELKDARWFFPKDASKIVGYKKDNLPLLKKALAILEK
ncbi:MAG: NUDIX hydrolase [Berkelbacteria bacterium GW2011_GWA1_39_10]|uniref:NUDIX hydrolase n=1 Tax=Berkelbacteria bacterium GW2011_GWA1_39_10 TaxID=1618332 RepID=A0A0G0LG58_9BACT|nr:MAG: NUDIX hydrolase [Berkelbacteria bacterium GW2011_GWA1_39_10]